MQTKLPKEKLQISEHSKKFSGVEEQEIATRLMGLATALDQALTPDRIEIYLQALSRIPFQRLKVELEKMLQTCQWFPKIPEIFKACGVSPDQRRDELLLQGERAWNNLQRYLERWRWDSEVNEFRTEFSGGKVHYPPPFDPATDYALRQVGGVEAIKYAEPNKTSTVRGAFIDAWIRWQDTEGLTKLAGAEEPTNLSTSPPRLLGPKKQ